MVRENDFLVVTGRMLLPLFTVSGKQIVWFGPAMRKGVSSNNQLVL